MEAVEQRRKADDISAVLYPNDATEYGKELRLKQQVFFVSASIQARPLSPFTLGSVSMITISILRPPGAANKLGMVQKVLEPAAPAFGAKR